MTSGIVQWIAFMITDLGFTHIYLRAIEGDVALSKEERYRFDGSARHVGREDQLCS